MSAWVSTIRVSLLRIPLTSSTSKVISPDNVHKQIRAKFDNSSIFSRGEVDAMLMIELVCTSQLYVVPINEFDFKTYGQLMTFSYALLLFCSTAFVFHRETVKKFTLGYEISEKMEIPRHSTTVENRINSLFTVIRGILSVLVPPDFTR